MRKGKGLIPSYRTKFLRIKCSACGNEQNVFSAASTKVKCLVCDQGLVKPTASKIVLGPKTILVRVFD